MTKAELKAAITEIGLALNLCHNCVATDLPEVEPDETSWRIDNSKALAQLDELAERLGVNVDRNR